LNCKRYIVSGHVQGVWYRGSTQSKANQLGLTGYAYNLDDGCVEVVACGDDQAISSLVDWLWQGPAGASVTNVEEQLVFDDEYDCFSTG